MSTDVIQFINLKEKYENEIQINKLLKDQLFHKDQEISSLKTSLETSSKALASLKSMLRTAKSHVEDLIRTLDKVEQERIYIKGILNKEEE